MSGNFSRTAVVRAIGVTIALTLLVAGGARHAAAQTVPIEAFFGVWKGSGIASSEGEYLDESVRDLDVTIRGAAGGFSVDWTTVIRKGPSGDRKVERRDTTKTFRATGRPGLYQATDGGDFLKGEDLAWARLDRQTLTIYRLVLNEAGEMELSRYDRTLPGGGMELEFSRQRGSEVIRRVSGRLVKVGQ